VQNVGNRRLVEHVWVYTLEGTNTLYTRSHTNPCLQTFAIVKLGGALTARLQKCLSPTFATAGRSRHSAARRYPCASLQHLSTVGWYR
jgi:hypothetical protein